MKLVCQLHSPPLLPRIKPSVNWFRSFVSTFVYTLSSFPSFCCFPIFPFSSLFSILPSSFPFFLPLSVFFDFHIATRFPNLYATRPLFLHATRYCNVSDIRSQHDLQFAADSRIIAKRSSIEVHFTLISVTISRRGWAALHF